MSFKKHTKPRSLEKRQEKDIILKNLHRFFKERERVFDAFESKIFSAKYMGAGILSPDHSRF